MRRPTLVVVLVVALLVAVPAAGLAAVGGDGTGADEATDAVDEQTNGTDAAGANETAPGQRLSGVVGVGEAELEGDLSQRAFGIQIANATTAEAQADVVADRIVEAEQRLDTLEQRKAELDRQREAGEISEGKYRAEVSRVAAETETIRQLANRSAQVGEQIPAEIFQERLADRGIDADAIGTLMNRANELSGPEVAEIARGIAGPNVGDTPAGDRPVDVPERPGDSGPGNGGPPSDDDDDQSGDGTGNTDDDRPGGGDGNGGPGSR